MTPEEARRVQEQMTAAHKHLRDLTRQRDQVFLQLSRAGYSPRQIAKIVGINYSVVYKSLERSGYTPKFSFTEGRLRNVTQQAIVNDVKAKMKTQGKQYV
jgi:transposase-like protein